MTAGDDNEVSYDVISQLLELKSPDSSYSVFVALSGRLAVFNAADLVAAQEGLNPRSGPTNFRGAPIAVNRKTT
jgi:hypothetical protein